MQVIYVARNPKDVSVSYYHYVRMLAEVHFNGNYQSFFDKFINDKGEQHCRPLVEKPLAANFIYYVKDKADDSN